MARRMISQQPAWLNTVLGDQSEPPRLFAWTTDNLGLSEKREELAAIPATNEAQRIYILGIGNLGRLLASSLSSITEPPPITLVLNRKESLSTWQEGCGIELTWSSGVITRDKNFNVEWWSDTAPTQGPVREVASGNRLHNLVVATKATAAIPSVDRVRRYLGSESTVLFVQNGMSKLWPPHGSSYASHRYHKEAVPSFLSGVVTHGLFSQGPFRSVHASEGSILVGPVLVNKESPNSGRQLIQQVAAAPHLNVTQISQMDLWIRQLEKLVVNSIINPLTALLRERNGFLFVEPHPDIVRVTHQLVTEASQVLQALVKHESSNMILAPLSETGTASEAKAAEERLEAIRGELVQRFSPSQLTEMLNAVGLVVKDNKSSMLQDIEAGLQTEITDFNGWLTDMSSFLPEKPDVSTHHKLINLIERRLAMKPQELRERLLG